MPLETAEAYRQLNEEFNLSHEEISRRVGKSRVSISNTLRLLKLPDKIKAALVEGNISEGHARALLALTSAPAQLAVLDMIVRNSLNVRQTEELVRKYGGMRLKSASCRIKVCLLNWLRSKIECAPHSERKFICTPGKRGEALPSTIFQMRNSTG